MTATERRLEARKLLSSLKYYVDKIAKMPVDVPYEKWEVLNKKIKGKFSELDKVLKTN